MNGRQRKAADHNEFLSKFDRIANYFRVKKNNIY